MENDEAHGPHRGAPATAVRVVKAVSQRPWERLDALADPEIEVRVSARADSGASPNEHVWRSVHVHGADQLHAYLGDLYAALPSLKMEARDGTHDGVRAQVSAEFSGVNTGGTPFNPFPHIQFFAPHPLLVLTPPP